MSTIKIKPKRESATPAQLKSKIWGIVKEGASLDGANLAIFQEQAPRMS